MRGTGELYNMSDDELMTLADENSAGWHTAETQEEKDAYHAENTEINKILDSRRGGTTTFDPVTGKWTTQGGTSAGGTAGQGSAGGSVKFSYENAPEYVNEHKSMLDDMTKQILGRPAFSYDPETDPSYQQYKDQYTRMGKLAMEDTLGQMAARTGGLASSYAGSAAQQSYNQYMSALGDKIPELRQLAYEMYKDEGDTQRANLNMLMGLEEMDYNKYRDKLGQYNTDRSFAFEVDQDAYGRQQDQAEWDYKLAGRAHDWDREAQKDAIDAHDREVSEAIDIYNATGDVTQLAAAWKLSPEYAQKMIDDYAWKENMTREEAAWELAEKYAKYGDLSKLEEIGVNTDNLRQGQTGQQRSDPPKDPEIVNRHGDNWVEVPGHGRYSYPELYEHVRSGQVKEIFDEKKNTYTYKWVG